MKTLGAWHSRGSRVSLLFLVGALSCSGGVSDVDKSDEELEARVTLFGCREVRDGPICFLPYDGERGLRLRIAGLGDAEFGFFAGARAIDARELAFSEPGERAFVLTLPEGVEEVSVRLVDEEQPVWNVSFGAYPSTDAVERYGAELGRDPHAAAELADAERAKTTGAEAILWRSYSASAWDRAGEWRHALAAYRDVAENGLDEGLVTLACEAAIRGLHITTTKARDLEEARSWRRLVRDFPGDGIHGDCDLERADLLGTHALRSLDLPVAERTLRRALKVARDLGSAEDQIALLEKYMETLQQVGAVDRARDYGEELHARVDSPEITGIKAADVLVNLAWFELSARSRGEESVDPTSWLEEALVRLEASPTIDQVLPQIRNVRLNLAHAALAFRHDAVAAREHLAAIDPLAAHHPFAEVEPKLLRLASELEFYEIRAQIAVADDDVGQALNDLHRVVDMAETPDLVYVRIRALSKMAQLYEQMGNSTTALELYEQADNTLADLVRRHGSDMTEESVLFRDVESFLQDADISKHRIDTLLKRGEHERAFCIARLARLRSMQPFEIAGRYASVDEEVQGEWRRLQGQYVEAEAKYSQLARDMEYSATSEIPALERRLHAARAKRDTIVEEALATLPLLADLNRTCGELSPAAEGEILMLFQEVDDGFVGFVDDGDKVAAVQLGDAHGAEPEDLGSFLFEPFADQIAAARRVKLLLSGSLLSQPIHTLRHRGRPLMDHVEVTYSFDLPPQAPVEGENMRAVVVGDPRGNLKEARKEAPRVHEALTSAGWESVALTGAQASGERLRREIGQVHLLHYAGHGGVEDGDGWGSALLLDGADTLGVTDILMLPSVPSAVVLSGCQTGFLDSDALLGGMNLARAFLAAGSTTVIATAEEIHDEDAAEFSRAFYSNLPAGPFDPVARLRAAQRARAMKSSAAGGIHSFRAWVR